MSATQHGTAVSVDGKAVLIVGPPGAGKTTFALEMMSHGARLVADDQVLTKREGDSIWLSPPETIAGMIEVYGLGILRVPFEARAKLMAIVDLTQRERERVPIKRNRRFQNVHIPLIYSTGRDILPYAIFLMLKYERLEDV